MAPRGDSRAQYRADGPRPRWLRIRDRRDTRRPKQSFDNPQYELTRSLGTHRSEEKMKKLVVAAPILALALGGTTACATKKMVRTQVGEVNGKVETLSKSVEETQERTRQNEGRISEVDQTAQAAGQRADAAGSRADEARAAADAVNAKADALDRASKRLVYEVTLSEDKGGFKFGKAVMPDEAKADLDALVQKLKAEPNGA